MVIVPPRYLDEIKALSESVLSFQNQVSARFLGIYTGLGVNDTLVRSVKIDLTKNIISILEELQDEVDYSITKHIGNCPEWKEIPLYNMLLHLVALLSGRIFVGLPLSRNDTWLEATLKYTIDGFVGAEKLWCYPKLLHPIMQYVISEVRNVRRYLKNGAKLLEPIMKQRQQAMREDPNFDKPSDMVQWIVDNSEVNNGSDTDYVTKTQMLISVVAIHTTTMTTAQALFDLVSHPEYIDVLREEVRKVQAEDGPRWTKASIAKLRKMDSFMKESQRFRPPGLVTMNRQVEREITLSNGVVLPKGVHNGVAAGPNALDPELFDDPEHFDGLRFAKLRALPGNDNKYQFVTTGPDQLHWGVGSHACPGRFFASYEIKMLLAEILIRYDIELLPGAERPRDLAIDIRVIPDPMAAIRFRNRKIEYKRQQKPQGTKWLPGPVGLPVIGRIWDIPRSHAYLRFKQWSDRHGPIYQINLFGTNHVWIASDKIASELLAKRATIHSDRPSINNLEDSKMAPEYLPLLGYNDVWRRQRKMVTQIMTQSAREMHKDLPMRESYQFIHDLLQCPMQYEDIMEAYTSRVISRLAFGDVTHAPEITFHSHALLKAISPGAYLTNVIPQLKKIPAMLSPWKREERVRHSTERAWFIEMHNNVKQKVRAGSTVSSYMSQALAMQTDSKMSDLESAYVVGMVGLAGILNTASALMTYILAMTLYPQWQSKLQAEADQVCGDRPPEPKDSPNMPVLRAVIKEIMRWRPVTPSSIPHESVEDDVYEGYFIPKGSHIHPSQWAITHDPVEYPDPEVFNPARWLEPKYPSYQEPLTKYPSIKNYTTFGYGRRICQGMDLVEVELFVAIGAMAWASTISRKRDALGRDMHVPSHDYTTYLISRPKPFPFELKPRNEGRRRIVEKNYHAAMRDARLEAETAKVHLYRKEDSGMMAAQTGRIPTQT
ncbi:cytochrome P450, partial [Aureobasidium melanogenum]